MKTLLTVDLDYWTNCYKHYNLAGGTWLRYLATHLQKIWVIKEHHQILDLIPRGTKRIINVDYHNDILGMSSFDDYEEKDDDLNEGTWGNFLPKSVCKFEWYYPSKKKCVEKGEGLCHNGYNKVFTDYPIEYHQQWHCFNADLTGVESIVICVSPQWADLHSPDRYLRDIGINPDQDFDNPLKVK